MPTFDVSSEVDHQEVRNAVDQAAREVTTRFDFKGTDSSIELDEAAGRASILGGLSASGWHTCAMMMRMMCDAFLLESTSQGAPGVDYVNWRKPVLAGDTLTGTVLVTERRRSKSRADLGFITSVATLRNQRDETVLELKNTGMFLLRDPEAAHDA